MAKNITYRYSSENGRVYQLDTNNGYVDVTDSISQAELDIIKKNSAGKGGGLDRISHQEVERQLNEQREAVAQKEAEIAAARQKEIDRVTAARKAAEEERNNKEFMTTSDNNVGESCAVCKESGLQCLCEVIIKETKSKDGSTNSYYWKSRKKENGIKRKGIPTVFLAPSFSGGPPPLKGENVNIIYQLIGKCRHGSEGECVESEILTLLVKDGKYQEEVKKGAKIGPIDLTYQDELKLYADITSKSIDIYPEQQSPTGYEFMRSLEFLLASQVHDYPVNYRKFSVAECDTNKKINKEKVVTHFVSLPLYEVKFELELSFEGEEVDSKLQQAFDDEGISPDAARYGRFNAGAIYEVKYNRVKAAIELPILSLTKTPIMNKVTTVFNKLNSAKKIGNASKGIGKDHFPVAASFHPPVAKINVTAAFGGGDQLIKREGTIGFEPLFGAGVQVDIYEIISNIGGGLGKLIKQGLTNKFRAVIERGNASIEEQIDIIKGEPLTTGFKAAGFFYFSGELDFKGKVKLAPSKLGSLKLPFEDPQLGAEIKLGLYAGAYGEARLWGIGGSFSVGVSVETSWEGYYYFERECYKIWHNGIWVKVYADAEFGHKSENLDVEAEGVDYGSLNDAPNIKGKVDWQGKLMDGGSEENPWLYSEEKKKSEDEKSEGKVAVNIKTQRISGQKTNEDKTEASSEDSTIARNTGGGGGR